MATSPASEIHNPAAPSTDGILLAEELLDLAERAQAYSNAAGVAIALRRSEELLVRTSCGGGPEVGTVVPLSDGFIAEAMKSRRPLTCRDTETDGRVGPTLRALKMRSLVAVPMCERRDAIGMMIVVGSQPNAFQPTHTAILMTLSDIVASKLVARDGSSEASNDSAAALASEPANQASVAPAAKPPQRAEVKPAHAIGEPGIRPDLTPPAVTPALLRTAASMNSGAERSDPGLLSPSEDPRRFAAAAGSSKLVAINVKHVKPVTTAAPDFEAPAIRSSKRPMLMGAAVAAAAVFIVGAGWMYSVTHKDIAAPQAAVPAVAEELPPLAASAPAFSPAKVTPVARATTDLTITTQPRPSAAEPAKNSKPTDTAAVEVKPEVTQQPEPRVMEIAAGHAKPKAELPPDAPAPSLALGSNDAMMGSLAKVPVALPSRPASEIRPAELVSRVAPTYPAIARQMGIYGSVIMNATISPSGSVSGVRVTSGPAQLRAAAVEAVRQWRYKPAFLDGKAVESSVQVQINFAR